jgi:hypothetical protein
VPWPPRVGVAEFAVATAAPSHRPNELELRICEIDSDGAAHIAALLRHSYGRLRVLTVEPSNGGLDPEDCQVLCESVPVSRTLRFLSIDVKEVLADTLRGAAGAGSPLVRLHVAAAFTDDGVASLAQQLRTDPRLV